MKKFKERTVDFVYNGIKFNHSFTPESEEDVVGFTQDGYSFLITYDECYGDICVYRDYDNPDDNPNSRDHVDYCKSLYYESI